MRDSVGKTAAREHFYMKCLPAWLTTAQLRSSGYVVLLGKPPEEGLPPEIRHLDDLGVPRGHVWCVEREPDIYAALAAFNRQQRPCERISLYEGEISRFLLDHLQQAQAVGVLNLDIEGSYLGATNSRDRADKYFGIDEAMTTVMLFCWRNPSTVVATYSSVGRDRIMLCEGIKSLVWLLAIDERAVLDFCSEMDARYALAGFEHPFRMVLRDLFWLRSHLEHTLAASVHVGVCSKVAAARFLAWGQEIWQSFDARGLKVCSLQQVLDAVRSCLAASGAVLARASAERVRLGMRFQRQKHVLYRGQRPWAHRCFYAMQTRADETVSIQEWLQAACVGFTLEPLLYIDIQGKARELMSQGIRYLDEVNVNDDDSLFRHFNPRVIPLRIEPTWRPTIAWLRQDIHDARHGPAAYAEPAAANQKSVNGSSDASQQATEGASIGMTRGKTKAASKAASANSHRNGHFRESVSKPRKFFDESGGLTDGAKAYIKHLATDRDLTAPEIMERVPDGVPAGTVRAFVAHASRAKK